MNRAVMVFELIEELQRLPADADVYREDGDFGEAPVLRVIDDDGVILLS